MDADIHCVERISVSISEHDGKEGLQIDPFECMTITVKSHGGARERIQLYSRNGKLPAIEVDSNIKVVRPNE